MNFLKRLLFIITAFITLLCVSISAAAYTGISPAAAPYSNKYTMIKWGDDTKTRFEHCGIPISFGEFLLLPAADKLLFLSEEDGTEHSFVQLPQKCSENYSPDLSEKGLLLPLEKGICLINPEKREISAQRDFSGEIVTDCRIYGNYGFFGVKSGEKYSFLCVDLSDSLKTLWETELSEQPSGGVVLGDFAVFASGSSIYTHALKSDVVNEIPTEKKITGNPFATEYALFFSTEDGYAGKLRLNEDGTAEQDTLTFCKTGEKSSSPLVWNGRLYTAAGDGFYILDSLNMEVNFRIEEIKGGCTPQAHYGSGPYIYTVAPYGEKYAVYSILDMDEEAQPTVTKMALMLGFSSGSFCASQNGTLYFRDDFGTVYALAKAPSDIFGLIVRLIVILALLALVFIWIKKLAKRREKLHPKY